MEEQFFGLTGEAAKTAQVMAGGSAGATLLIYLRHPGTILRALFLFAISMILAELFGQYLAETEFARDLGLNIVKCAALVALMGKAVANGLLRAVEKFDFGVFWREEKG